MGLSLKKHQWRYRESLFFPLHMRYYLTMATRKSKTPPKEPLKVCTVKLTAAEERLLREVSQDASDVLGWTVSNSAVLRACIHYMQQAPEWTTTALHPLIEQEIAQGRVWGSKRRLS
jgi:hypothetical protein